MTAAFTESVVEEAALAWLNPKLPAEALEAAFRKIIRAEGATPESRNRAIHRLLVDGVTVEYRRPDGSIAGAQVRVVDFAQPDANDWLAVNQFTVAENKHTRRPDVVLFINGLPLALMELKNAADESASIQTAIDQKEAVAAMLEKYEVCCGLFHGFDHSKWVSGTLSSGSAFCLQRRSTSSRRGTARTACSGQCRNCRRPSRSRCRTTKRCAFATMSRSFRQCGQCWRRASPRAQRHRRSSISRCGRSCRGRSHRRESWTSSRRRVSRSLISRFSPTNSLPKSKACHSAIIGNYYDELQKVVGDGKHQRIEQCLNEFVVKLEAEAVRRKREAEHRERQERLWEERERRRREREEKQRKEMERLKALEEEVREWKRAEGIRAYVAAVEAQAAHEAGTIDSDSELGEWLAWARHKADWIDPLVNAKCPVLDGDEE